MAGAGPYQHCLVGPAPAVGAESSSSKYIIMISDGRH
jgi:hypothetical protein